MIDRTVPNNKGLVVWPAPGPLDQRDPDHPSRALDRDTATGWFDDGQGGMVVYLAARSPQYQPGPYNEWLRCPVVECDHYLSVGDDFALGDYLALVPIGVSNWCWWHSDGNGGYYPFEATYADLTPDGQALYELLSRTYEQPVFVVTHIDT